VAQTARSTIASPVITEDRRQRSDRPRPDHPNKQTFVAFRQKAERAKFNNLALQFRRSKPQE